VSPVKYELSFYIPEDAILQAMICPGAEGGNFLFKH
jgi:hypothetical protein